MKVASEVERSFLDRAQHRSQTKDKVFDGSVSASALEGLTFKLSLGIGCRSQNVGSDYFCEYLIPPLTSEKHYRIVGERNSIEVFSLSAFINNLFLFDNNKFLFFPS